MIFLIFFTFIFSVFAQENETGNTENAFSLTIIHTNDIHAHFMESDKEFVLEI
jgi:2',3'-cyclic-nucleotide 2'-phosphodiesterase (5'-nucleotidase family)